MEDRAVEGENIRVLARLRPPKMIKGEEWTCITRKEVRTIDQNLLTLENKDQLVKVKFDKVFDHQDTQPEVFEYLQHISDDIVNGVSSGILAYGQTGSGRPNLMRQDVHYVREKPVIEAT